MNLRPVGYALALVAFIAVSAYAFDIEAVDPDAVEAAGDRGRPPLRAPGDVSVDGEAGISSESSGNNIADAPVSQPLGGVADTVAAPAEPEIRRPASREELGRMSREELFRLAFGGGAERPRNLTLNLIAEGVKLGTAEIVYDARFSSFEFISPNLSHLLDALLLPEARPAAGDSVGFFSSAVLRSAGYAVVDNVNMHELHISLPPEGKAIQRLNLRGGYAMVQHGESVNPAFASFYLNYTLRESFTYQYGVHNLFGGHTEVDNFMRARAGLNLNGALAMLKWVLEGSAQISEPPDGVPFAWENYRRGDVWLSRDFVSRHVKLALGDIGMAAGGGTVGGVRCEYNKRQFGNNPRDDESSIVFFMPKAGEVEVFMDGVYRQRFYLPAGHHEVRGFGGQMGRNNVQLMLRMADGSVEEVPFEYVLGNPGNINRGESRYTLAAGVRRESAPSPACYNYVAEEPAVSYDYLYGLTRNVSVGVLGLSSRYNNVARGQTMLDLGFLGWTSIQCGANYMPSAEAPVGGRVDVSYQPSLHPGIKKLNRMLGGGVSGGPLPYLSTSFRAFYQSASYTPAPFGGSPAENAVMAGVSGNMGFGLLYGGISGNGTANFYRETAADSGRFYPVSYSYGVRLSQTVFNIPVNAGAGANVVNGVTTPYFSVSMSHGFGVGLGLGTSYRRHQLTASTGIGTGMAYAPLTLMPVLDTATGDVNYEFVPDTRVGMSMGGSANFGWRWSNGGYGTNAQSYSVSTGVPNIFDPQIPGFYANMDHSYNRAQLSANYNYSNYAASLMDMQSHYLNATLSGSFMFADGLWAFGRPVSGGFALVDARHSLKGANVHVDRSHHARQDLSRNGWLGSAYKNNVSAYSPTHMLLTLTDPPPGAMLQNNRFYTTGEGYRQGYALRLGGKDGVLMEARFTSGGHPVAYTYATLEPDGPRAGESARRATFTGGNGVLQMGDLAAGKSYRIKFNPSANIRDVVITIPRGSGLLFETEVEVDRLAD